MVERRKSPRINARLAMEIRIGGDTAHVETINVSASGVYFSVSKYIEPLTRLQIDLDLPDPDRAGKRRRVTCNGVVVRVSPEDEIPDQRDYEVACYFTDVTDRETLESYILKHVPF